MLCFNLDTGLIPSFDTQLNYDNTDGARPGTVRQVQNSDGSVRLDVWAYNGTGGALTAGRPYFIKIDAGSLAHPLRVAVPATLAVPVSVVIATAATADAKYGWFTFAGHAKDVQVTATAIAIGDPLEVINAGVTLIEDTAGGTVGTVGQATEANVAGGAQSVDVYLFGRAAQIAAA